MASLPRTPYQAAARELLRTTLLEAARELLRERRWQDITMAEIAAGASVSRQTLYNEFGTRQGFVQAYLLYDADRILTAVEQAIAGAGGDPAATLHGAFSVFLETIAADPLAIAVLSGEDDDGLLTLVTTKGAPVLAYAAYRLSEAIHSVWPQARADDVRMLSEHLVRLALSHAALPSADPSGTAAQVAAMLTPFAERALGRVSVDASRAA